MVALVDGDSCRHRTNAHTEAFNQLTEYCNVAIALDFPRMITQLYTTDLPLTCFARASIHCVALVAPGGELPPFD